MIRSSFVHHASLHRHKWLVGLRFPSLIYITVFFKPYSLEFLVTYEDHILLAYLKSVVFQLSSSTTNLILTWIDETYFYLCLAKSQFFSSLNYVSNVFSWFSTVLKHSSSSSLIFLHFSSDLWRFLLPFCLTLLFVVSSNVANVSCAAFFIAAAH